MEPLCWKKYNYGAGIQYAMCDEGYCRTEWEYCFDGIDIIRTKGSSTKDTGSVCDTIIPANPPLGEWSDCFYVITVCDD